MSKRPSPPGGATQRYPQKRSGGEDNDDEPEFEAEEEIEDMQPPDENVPEIELGEAGRNWQRPDPGYWDPATRDIGAYWHDVSSTDSLMPVARCRPVHSGCSFEV